MNITELEKLAKGVEARGDRVMMLSTGKVINLCELLREMGEALHVVRLCTPPAQRPIVDSALAKWKEMTK